MKRSLSAPQRPGMAFVPRLHVLAVAMLLLPAACGAPISDDRTDPAAASASGAGAVVQSATEPGDTSLIGRLLDDVAPDSALLSSWGIYPLERHIGIRLVHVGDAQYLLADTLVGYDGPRAQWRVRQAQRVEPAGAGEAWVGSCLVGRAETSDGTVVARVTLSAGDTLAPIHAAWRLDPDAWRFRLIAADSLFCYNEGSGGP